MTDSLVNSLKIGVAALALSATTSLGAMAQNGPVKLAPPVSLSLPSGQSEDKNTETVNPIKALPPIDQVRSGSGIQVDSLGAVNPESAGTLSPETGGLPIDLWKGTDRSLVERLLAEIPGGLVSPTMRELARRLLLSMATPPEGEAREDLLNQRIDRLAAMGDLAAVGDLIQAVPNRTASP